MHCLLYALLLSLAVDISHLGESVADTKTQLIKAWLLPFDRISCSDSQPFETLSHRDSILLLVQCIH